MNRRLGLKSSNTGEQTRPLKVDIRPKGTDAVPIEATYKVRTTNPDLQKLIAGRNNWKEGTDVLSLRAHILGRDNLDLPRDCPPQQSRECPNTAINGDQLESSMADGSPIPQECVDCVARYILAATSQYKDVRLVGDLL